MKKCTICKSEKLEIEFHKSRLTKDKLQNVCKQCSSKISRKYYLDKTEQHKEATKKRRLEKRREIKERIESIKDLCGCAKCGEKDSACIDFHHADATTKDFEVSMACKYEWSWIKVLHEIEKCVCLCANCHRKFHAGRFELDSSMLCKIILENQGYFVRLEKLVSSPAC